MKKLILFFYTCLCLSLGWAQSDYTDELSRGIKALSEKDIENYLQGNGMGFAKAAELNHYPGPKHVLELADDLSLSPTQIEQTTKLFNDMKNQAVNLGHQLVDLERQLNELFVTGEIDEKQLKSQLNSIKRVKSELRFVHLSTHLKQKSILTQRQVRQYDRLRGYTSHQHQHNHQI